MGLGLTSLDECVWDRPLGSSCCLLASRLLSVYFCCPSSVLGPRLRGLPSVAPRAISCVSPVRISWGQGSDSVVREALGPGESGDMMGKQKKCVAWQHGSLLPAIPPSQSLPSAHLYFIPSTICHYRCHPCNLDTSLRSRLSRACVFPP